MKPLIERYLDTEIDQRHVGIQLRLARALVAVLESLERGNKAPIADLQQCARDETYRGPVITFRLDDLFVE